jgi:hypothetical protein
MRTPKKPVYLNLKEWELILTILRGHLNPATSFDDPWNANLKRIILSAEMQLSRQKINREILKLSR